MRLARVASLIFAVLGGYILLWPVPVDPVAWTAPRDPGYQGAFRPNHLLAKLERLPLAGLKGAEDLALAPNGGLYASTHEGKILRLSAQGTDPQIIADTGGRPLGIETDRQGRILVADAMRGLLSVTSSGTVTTLTTEADGIPIVYADDVAVSPDGDTIYFSDASTKFGAAAHGGTFPASKLDMMEHGAHGRVLVYDRRTQKTTVLMRGLQFANGVALSEDGTRLVVSETGMYRLLVHHLAGPDKGRTDVLIDNLPGFPDNVERGRDGRFWVGLVSARSKPLDSMANTPLLRKIVQRLPAFMRPDAVRYGHVFAVDLNGEVQVALQDPSGDFAKTTGAMELGDYLFVTSLSEPDLGRLAADPSW